MSTVVPLSVSVPLEIRGAGTRPQTSETGTRFHLSLNVSSIERMASFLQLVLGVLRPNCEPIMRSLNWTRRRWCFLLNQTHRRSPVP